MDDNQLDQRFQGLAMLITSLKESLESEIHAGFAGVNGRLDSQSVRLERQGALLQTGSRWTARMNEWAEKVDSLLEEQARDISELREEIRRLGGSGLQSP